MKDNEFTRDELLGEARLLPPDHRAKFLREWGLLDAETCPGGPDGSADFSTHPNLQIARLIWLGDEEAEDRAPISSDSHCETRADELVFGDEVSIELDRPVRVSSCSFVVGLFPRKDVYRWLEVLLAREDCPPPEDTTRFVRVKVGFPFEKTCWATADEVRHYLWPLIEEGPASSLCTLSAPSPEFKREEPNDPRFMTIREWDRAFAAISFANWSGFVFNVELTIAWTKLGLTDDAEIVRAFETFMKRARSWHKQRDLKPRIWWVWEGSTKVGLHTHLGLVLPPECRGDPKMRRAGKATRKEFAGFRDWLAATLGSLSPHCEMTPTAVEESGAFDLVFRDRGSVASQWRWFAYASKSLHPGAALGEEDEQTGATKISLLHSSLRLRSQPSGAVPRDRVGATIAIGPGERREAGYASPCERQDIPLDQFFSGWELRRGQLERAMKEQAARSTEILQAVLALQELDRRWGE